MATYTNTGYLWRLQLAYLIWLVGVTLTLCLPSGPESQFTFLHSKQAQFAKGLQNYQITIPEKVTKTGTFLSHSVNHVLPALRHKRSLGVTQSTLDGGLLEKIHYKLKVDNKNLHLELQPNDKLISPGFVIERRNKGYQNLSHANIKAYPQNKCHYVGKVKGDPLSQVALATCDGLHGLISTTDGQYMIEPLKGNTEDSSPKHAHLIYNRTSLPAHLDVQQSSNRLAKDQQLKAGSCGVEESYGQILKDRDAWQRENHQETRKNRRRKKRSFSVERYVEVMVVVDKDMMEYYENDDVETYVLTIMNMVSMLYHDSSIGNAINVVLVNMMLMDYEEKQLKITHHADNTLRSFCKWQKSINPKKDSDPNHHDVAILITRRNICSKRNEPCSTLGLSQVNGLCQPHRSCNINEDTGLSLAYTVSHELGHNFGMQHDGPENGCQPKTGKYQLMMSAQLNAEACPMVWSSCSEAAITKFLDRDWGFCLDDEPLNHDFYLDERPPGIKYDAEHQCKLQYGDDATFCEGIDNQCSTLWCRVQNKCMTRLEAAAEGTICGDNKWCSGGKCVTQGESSMSQNGEWGEWGSWSKCSRPCGAGVAYTERHCDNPRPKNGGKYCLGERKRFRICNTDACAEDSLSFQHIQCSDFNGIPYKGQYYKWEYVVNPRTPCQLHCRPKGHFFSVMLADIVKDGTPCSNKGARAMCISGICRQVGCDWDIDSEALEDGCGVCRGDGSTCKTVKSKFEKEQGLGYVEATVIPMGARNIRIEEVAESNNYLAVRNDEGEYYLNGGWFIQWNGEYEAAGTVMSYERDGDKEMLSAPGPLKEPLHIMLLFQSENPGVEFEFTVPKINTTDQRAPEFKWIYSDWTHCTQSCGGGNQRSQVACSDLELGIVSDMYCNISTMPEDMGRGCNEHPCPPRWWPGHWQHCSLSCGGKGVRRRTVLCVRSSGNGVHEALDDSQCKAMKKPDEQELCKHNPKCETAGIWEEGPWSSCTLTCDGGTQMRSVLCQDESGCSMDDKPASERTCNPDPCINSEAITQPQSDQGFLPNANTGNETFEVWNLGSQEKNQTVKKWKRTDQLKLGKTKVKDNFRKLNVARDIPKSDMPTVEEDFMLVDPKGVLSSNVKPFSDQYIWVPLPWNVCSVSCGGGQKQREVKCFHKHTLEESQDRNCQQLDKPTNSAECNDEGCVHWATGQWGDCSKTCDNGYRTRNVDCVQQGTTGVPSGRCDENSKPSRYKKCHMPPCSDPNEAKGTNKLNCHGNVLTARVCQALKEMGSCWHRAIQVKCCQTCQNILSVRKNHGQKVKQNSRQT